MTDQSLTEGARSDVRAPDGTRLAVYEWGKPEGLEVLLVHGFAQCHLCFEPQIRALIQQALARSGASFQAGKRGTIVIKSISARQRPRRPPTTTKARTRR